MTEINLNRAQITRTVMNLKPRDHLLFSASPVNVTSNIFLTFLEFYARKSNQ